MGRLGTLKKEVVVSWGGISYLFTTYLHVE